MVKFTMVNSAQKLGRPFPTEAQATWRSCVRLWSARTAAGARAASSAWPARARTAQPGGAAGVMGYDLGTGVWLENSWLTVG